MKKGGNMKSPDWATLRGEFPTLDHWTYLDFARTPADAFERSLFEGLNDLRFDLSLCLR